MLESLKSLLGWVEHIDENMHLGTLSGSGKHGLRNIADAIQAEVDERYMLLPVDRSGETWHIGDKFAFAGADGRKHICTVSGVSDCEVFFYYDEHSSSTKHRHFTARAIAHVKPRTLEDVLIEYRLKAYNLYADQELAGDERVDEFKKLDAEYDSEIRDMFGGDAE